MNRSLLYVVLFLLALCIAPEFLQAQEQLPVNRAMDVPKFVLPSILGGGISQGFAANAVRTLRTKSSSDPENEIVLSSTTVYSLSLEGNHVLTGQLNGALTFLYTSTVSKHGSSVTTLPMMDLQTGFDAPSVPGTLERYSELEYYMVGIYKHNTFGRSGGGYLMGYEVGYATVRYNHRYTAVDALPQGLAIKEKELAVPNNDVMEVNASGKSLIHSYNVNKTLAIGYTMSAYYIWQMLPSLSIAPVVTASVRSGVAKGMGNFSANAGIVLRFHW